MNRLLKFIVFFCSFIFTCECTFSNTRQYQVPVLVLSGTPMQMGFQYGKSLQPQLKTVLSVLEDYYITQHHISYDDLLMHAKQLYDRFSPDNQKFIQGEAKGSKLGLSNAIVLNAMETLGELLSNNKNNNGLPKCAYIFIPGNKTTSGFPLIGRNYDYNEPFNQLSRYLVVTILKQPDKIPTAFISIAGEAYCPSCVNEKGIFMELNSGSPSGGHKVGIRAKSMLSRMLMTSQNASTLTQVAQALGDVSSDFSLIVNTNDTHALTSFEYSTDPSLGMKYFYPAYDIVNAVTNFFLDPLWGNHIPIPTDETTWMGVTRRNNLLNLGNSLENQFDVPTFQTLMNTPIQNGGALWSFTIYQLILDESNLDLYVKINSESSTNWTKIPLKNFFM